jgi:hypothetical protein
MHEADEKLRALERRASSGEASPAEIAAGYARVGRAVPAEHRAAVLDHYVAEKREGLKELPDHERAAVHAALPHLRDSIHHWMNARSIEDTHGEEIRKPEHPNHDEAVKARYDAYEKLTAAKKAAAIELRKGGAVRPYQSTGSWLSDAAHSGHVDGKARDVLHTHVADLMAGHAPQHRRQYLARMHGATTGGNTWHWGYGTKEGEQPRYFTKKSGHETYHFDSHSDMRRFQSVMHKDGHETSVTDGPTDPSTVDPGDPDSGVPMYHELHVKTSG